MAWTDEDSLVLAIVMGLRKGLGLCHGMRRQLTEPEQFKVGRKIAAEIREANFLVSRGPPALPHGGGWKMSPDKPPEG